MVKILVTGFGSFPGTYHNPSSALLAMLQEKRARLVRLGITLELRILPVVYAGLGERLATLAAELQPDAILHFGVAGRRKTITLETRACNRVSPIHPDSHGDCPRSATVLPGRPHAIPARMPIRQILSAWQRAGIAGRSSNNAGDYLCNATLYHSLAAKTDVARVGFIHIPHPRRHASRLLYQNRKPPRLSDIGRAAEIAIVLVATAIRHETRIGHAASAEFGCTAAPSHIPARVTTKPAPGFSP